MSKIRFVKKEDLAGFLAYLRQRDITVLAPVEKPSASKSAIVFAPWEKGMPVLLAKATVSPKNAVLPECEALFTFRQTREENNGEMDFSENINGKPTVVFGCRPCDARGFAALDKPFLSGIYPDPYYKAKRDGLTVISLTCNSGCETCFCHWVGGGPTSPIGSDVLMTEIEEGFVLQVMTPRGENLLNASSLDDGTDRFGKVEAVRKAAWTSLVPAPNIMDAPAKLAEAFNDIEFWHEMTDRCLSCGACTYFCPTCYCFNITDEGEAQRKKGGRRLRSWDNCMSSLYTREASGHNPRTRKAQRMRNRVSHKFWTFPENWGTFLCSGCGRCITNCPVCLDIREIVVAAINRKSAQ